MTKNSNRAGRRTVRHREQREHPFYPNHFLRILMAVMATIAFMAILAAVFPLPLDRIADPLAEPAPGTRALWIIKPAILLGRIMVKPGLTAVLIAALALLFVMLPVLDTSSHRSMTRRALVAVPFLAWMLFLILSTLLSSGGAL